MSIQHKHSAALALSAAFVFLVSAFSSVSIAQAPIVDASIDSSSRSQVGAAASPPAQANTGADTAQASGSSQGEIFYQLQLLQQEVMQLRGIVEEQSYLLKQVKEQNMERYIDLDRRVGELTAGGAQNANSGAGAKAIGPISTRPAVEASVMAGEKEAYDAAYGLVTSRRFDEALDAFKVFLVDFPNGRYAPNSHYWMGELYQVIQPQNLEGARQSFTLLLSEYPGNAKVPDAKYKLGKVYYLKGNKSKARELLEQVVTEYSNGPNSSSADKAKQFINANF
ncbi:tol-pal system protein YbgF [Oceanicoccus sp. KOV_DT_Chl]|uniref:tol-pal system protein YbgF n=1 Tax=Oceanicoccus sp. KOV_DT_Chl TaxID=1904639 RepID=UPI000C7B2FEA|nr:tol-pal system protein YbgF [Oceanicoccus sp. KOV_DT_Chl]